MSVYPHTSARLRRSVLVRLASSLAPAERVNAPAGHLLTERLVLRPLEEADAPEYARLLARSRAHLARFFPLHRFNEPDDDVCDRHLAFSRAARVTGRAWRRVLCLHRGDIIGAININDIDRFSGSAETNFWIEPAHASLGYASEGVGAAVEHALSPKGLALQSLRALVAPDNIHSLRLLTSLGFQRDPAASPVQLNLAGRWSLHHAYVRRAA